MEISTWKKWFSYLKDIHIETRSSEYNPELHVVISKGRYQLLTDNAIYSHEDLYDNFAKILQKDLDLTSKDINKVLVLGLGLGSIPIILDNIRPGQWQITAVEIDEEICDLANIYGYPKIQSDIQTVTTDAAVFMDITSDSYDIICVDLFVGDQTPQKFKSKIFLQNLKEHLEPNGLIIYNTLAYTRNDKKQSKEFFDTIFSKVFSKARSIYAHRNNMLISHSDWLRR